MLAQQNQEHGRLHQKLLNQISQLEEARSRASVEIGRVGAVKSVMEGVSPSGRVRRVSAITIERGGKVGSPLILPFLLLLFRCST